MKFYKTEHLNDFIYSFTKETFNFHNHLLVWVPSCVYQMYTHETVSRSGHTPLRSLPQPIQVTVRLFFLTNDEFPPNSCSCSYLTFDDIPGAILKKRGYLPLSSRLTMCYLFTAHLASSFDIIYKGINLGSRIFEIM